MSESTLDTLFKRLEAIRAVIPANARSAQAKANVVDMCDIVHQYYGGGLEQAVYDPALLAAIDQHHANVRDLLAGVGINHKTLAGYVRSVIEHTEQLTGITNAHRLPEFWKDCTWAHLRLMAVVRYIKEIAEATQE